MTEAHVNNHYSDLPKRIGLADMDGSKYAAFGSLFILAVDSCLYPLDTIKTIIMSQRTKVFRQQSLPYTLYSIAKKEGILRFWKGLGPSVVGSFPGQAAYFTTYESVQSLTEYIVPIGQLPQTSFQTFCRGFVSGAVAEFAGGAFYVPADVVAQRLQVQSLSGFVHNCRLYTSPVDVVKKIFRTDGIRGFYRGYLAYVTAYAPGSAVQWGSYELFKNILYRIARIFNPTQHATHSPTPPHTTIQDTIITGTSGALASTCSIITNNPLEILRIRTQLLDPTNKHDLTRIRNGYWGLANEILREEGWKAFYRGMGVRMVVSVPTAMIAMSGYETIKVWSTVDES